MLSLRHFLFPALPFALGLSILACSSTGESDVTMEKDDSPVVAQMGKRPITLNELHKWMQEDLIKNLDDKGAAEAFELRSLALSSMIDEELLIAEADKSATTPKELLERQMGEPSPIPESEVRRYYIENINRSGRAGPPYEKIVDQLRKYLEAQRDNEFRDLYLRVLREDAGVQVFMQPVRVEVAATGGSIGPADAPITIVEFSDYECPFCKNAEPALWKLVENYPDKIRWVYRHFPLAGMHQQATTAAEATVCANRQGKFWEFHRLVFSNTRDMSPERLKIYAEKVGLDVEIFNTCLDGGEAAAEVQQDLLDGEAAGVTGTPAFFLNGIPFTGALPYEEFDRMVQTELSRIEAEEADSL